MRTHQELQKITRSVEKNDGRLAAIFQALSDAGRLRIIRLLLKYRNLCVTEIAHILNVSVPAASQQLRFLELSGIIRRVRNGQMICYEMEEENPIVSSVIKIISK